MHCHTRAHTQLCSTAYSTTITAHNCAYLFSTATACQHAQHCHSTSNTVLHSFAALNCCSHTQRCDTLCNAQLLLHCSHLLLLLSTTMYSVCVTVVCHSCRVILATTRVYHSAHSSRTFPPFSHSPADESVNTAVRAKTGSRHSAVTPPLLRYTFSCIAVAGECYR